MKEKRGWRASRHCGRGERGQVAVLFALLVPMFLALSTVVLDVGNMYVHKKHLQTLVDAGAFAGATKFVGCSFQFGDPAGANQGIRETALRYAGDTFRDPDTYNLQVQKPGDVRVVLNSARYWAENDRMDGVGFDDTLDPDGDPATPGDPCSTKTLDVKATDHDVPLLTGLIPIRPDAKSKARVEIRQVIEQSGMLPWAVPEVDPAAVVALFVREDTGAVLKGQRLDKADVATLPFLEWKTPDDAIWNVDLQTENIGVIILISKVDPMPSVGGSLAQICGQSPGLVKCYAGSGNQDGLTFIHGWSDQRGTPAQPVVRDVSVTNVLGPNRCEDLSAPYFLMTGDCDLGVTATLHFGSDPLFDPQTAVVRLLAPGCNSRNGCTMAYSGTGGPGETIWTTTQYARFSDDFFGRSSFSLRVTTEFPVGQTNEVTFANVAHPYVAAPAVLQGNQAPPAVEAGPVEYLVLTTADPGVLDANTRNTGDPALASVIVTVGIRRPFQVESPLVDPVVLRVASPSGSQNQAFDCDTGINFQNEIQSGCRTTYRENYGDWDEDGVKEWRDILCADYPNGTGLPPPTFLPTPPTPVPDCVRVEPGDKIGQFRQGIAARIKNPACAPNNWPEDPADYQDFFRTYDFANDPRYVTLIVTDYGAFTSQGSSQAVPVKYFAGFYITGWDKTGNNPECADNEPHPWYPPNYRRSLDNGDVWGHFINVVVFSSAGLGDDELCNFDEVGTCIAVLVE